MVLKVVENDNQFRIESQHFCTDWVSDTDENHLECRSLCFCMCISRDFCTPKLILQCLQTLKNKR